MPNSSRKTIFTTISIDKETAALVEKICKRYSLKKSEVVKLAFGYIDKAHINPSGCIRCFCCHEMCPAKAIAVRRIPLFRL